MPQKLMLPFSHPVLSAGYLHPGYTASWGYPHYGWDMGCDEEGYSILACGTGRVAAAGLDGEGPHDHLGYCLVLVYPQAELHDGTVRDVACRIFHMAGPARVGSGDTVRTGTVLGEYGNTGGGCKGRHLHIEFGLNADCPQLGVGVAAGGRVIRRSGDPSLSLSPGGVFWRKKGQGIRGCHPGWYVPMELTLADRVVRTPGSRPVQNQETGGVGAAVQPGMQVSIRPNAVWGGLTAARGRPVPSCLCGGNVYLVDAVAVHRGAAEALLGSLCSWVALESLVVI